MLAAVGRVMPRQRTARERANVKRYFYLNDRLATMIETIGDWATEAMRPTPPDLKRRYRDAGEERYNLSAIIRIAVDDWARELEDLTQDVRTPAARAARLRTRLTLDRLRPYLHEYAEVMDITPGVRRQITVYQTTITQLDSIHAALTLALGDQAVPILTNKNRSTSTNDILVLTMAVARLAANIDPSHPLIPCP